MRIYNILHLEDSTTDADLVKRVIQNSGLTCTYAVADNKQEFMQELEVFKPDMILSDHTLPTFNSKMAFALAREKYPDIPFLLVTGTVSEEFAVEMIKFGVDDYLLKSNLQRLPSAISNAFAKRANEEKMNAMRLELQQSETHLRSIFDNSAMGIILLDESGKILELNDRTHYFTKTLFDRQLKKGDHLQEVLPSYRKSDFQQKFTNVLLGKSVDYETLYEPGNNQKVYIQVKINPIIADQGTITGACINFEDITEQKRAQEAIRDSEIFNRSILTSIRSHIAVVDEKGLIQEVNDAWSNFSKNNSGEILDRIGTGSNYLEVCRKAAASGDETATKVLQGFLKVSKKEIPFFELVYPCHSPEEDRWFQLTITKFLGDSGKVVMSHTDITELKKASKEAADYKNALDKSGILDIIDQQGRIKHVNENFCSISQYSSRELIGQDYSMLNSGLHSKAFIKKIWLTIGRGKIWRGEICNKAKDGSLYWVDTTMVPFLDEKGKPFQYIAISWNITKRKIAETGMREAIERYDILAQATSDTIWDWDIVSNKMRYNEGITQTFGYEAEKVENVIGWWEDKLHSEDFDKVKELLADVFEQKLQRFQLNYRFRCDDGGYKYIFDRAFVIFDESGNPVRVIGAMQDITYQTEEEKRVAKAIIDAQEQERNFLGAELHDNINQILAVSLISLGIARSKGYTTMQRIEFITSAIDHINDALSETRKLSHNLAPASFDDNSLKDLFENLLFSLNLDDQFKIVLHFDEFHETTLSEQIQINLCGIL